MGQQQLSEHAVRPATTRQLGIERRKAAGADSSAAAAELMGAPQRGMQQPFVTGRLVCRKSSDTC